MLRKAIFFSTVCRLPTLCVVILHFMVHILPSNLRQHYDVRVLDKALSQSIPTYVGFHRSSLEFDKRGVDIWVRRQGARPLAVDVKNRGSDPREFGEDDVCLELASNLRTGREGWAVDPNKRTDLLVWLFPSGRHLTLSARAVRTAIERHLGEWRRCFPVRIQENRTLRGYTYFSECIFVRREVLERAIANI